MTTALDSNTAATPYVALLATVLSGCFALMGCGGGDDASTTASERVLAIAKATCGGSDKSEPGLQGQTPMPDRAVLFPGYNCNMTKTGEVAPVGGYGIWRQFALVKDRSGHTCGFSGGLAGEIGRPELGTAVVDLTDPDRPIQTVTLMTPAMQGPGEGLRAHQERGLLVSAYYVNAPRTAEVTKGFDVYDVGTDCRYPQLLATTTSITFDATDIAAWPGEQPYTAQERAMGHEGAFAPDGLTYYISDLVHGLYHAIDLTDPTAPVLLSSFANPGYKVSAQLNVQAIPHGLSLSNDGNTGYMTTMAYDWTRSDGVQPQTGEWHNGFLVVDTSEVQARLPNAKMRFKQEVTFHDASAEQLTIPVTIGGKPYVITWGEGGGGLGVTGFKNACAAGITPFSAPRIFDIESSATPTLVNKLTLEAGMPVPEVCATITPEMETAGGNYNVHMCSVDNRDDATTLACTYYQAGIRVFDIRNPKNVKEVAYFNPAAVDGIAAGLGCAALPFLDAAQGRLYTSCVNTGIVALKFTNGVWPFPESKTPSDRQL
ncbi:LVIVD repeat-containing protein [Pseudorhodoferax soli]|uniref:LVIVD repeat-containing protein n=1 Tax=Pseudorhodoferax soli TaxID=545864 RepID=UPI0011C029F5|nr:hypothetical protein [Pseudorhodoferax soli]